MTERSSIGPELTPAQQLHAACLDLQQAIRTQEKRSLTLARLKARQNLERLGALAGMTASQQKQEVESTAPGVVTMRQRLRDTFVVPLGTRLTGEGHSVSHFWSVYEPGELEQPGVVHLVVDELERESGTNKVEISRLYDLFASPDDTQVIHAGSILDQDQLGDPLKIIQAARELYA